MAINEAKTFLLQFLIHSQETVSDNLHPDTIVFSHWYTERKHNCIRDMVINAFFQIHLFHKNSRRWHHPANILQNGTTFCIGKNHWLCHHIHVFARAT